ncbi:MAG: hypothetical protein EAZ37_03225 [Burkholderiales bacterium]|nr:MAG: hypothetical protein EAZ37_03225 [Burkholderiales bacterium]
MPIPSIAPTSSLRLHPNAAEVFKTAENRHLTEEELALYERNFPAMQARANAARAIAAAEQGIVENVVNEILVHYPFEDRHAYARTKCVRDISSVSAFATLCMLMNDPAWFRDKQLLWLRTILQALYFPDRETTRKRALFASQSQAVPEGVPVNARAIWETYSKLRNGFKDKLDEESNALFEPYIQLAIDTLTAG